MLYGMEVHDIYKLIPTLNIVFVIKVPVLTFHMEDAPYNWTQQMKPGKDGSFFAFHVGQYKGMTQ